MRYAIFFIVHIIYQVQCVTDLPKIDRFLTSVYKTPDPNLKQELLDRLQLYLITLRRYNTMVRKGCTETCEEASALVHSGGPEFLKTHPFYSDEEQVFRYKMNFTDYVFQEYQYYRLDNENEWSELKDQIAHLDRDKEQAKKDMQSRLEGIGITLSEN